MNKSQLIDAIAAESGLSKKDAEASLKATLNAIEGALTKGDKVVLVGFGTFKTKKLAARSGRTLLQALQSRLLLLQFLHSRLASPSRIRSTQRRAERRSNFFLTVLVESQKGTIGISRSFF